MTDEKKRKVIDLDEQLLKRGLSAKSEPRNALMTGSPTLNHVPTAAEVTEPTLEEKIRERMERSAQAQVRVDPFIGQVIGGKFEITNKIGAGGMGVVYRARQKGMDRNVAIKVLLDEYMTNPDAVMRFEREALAVSKLQHPNSIRIYDIGETNNGSLYIAMEFLSGWPLDRLLLHEGQLSVRQTIRIVLQVARSLDEAHRKGIIHRDLKPDNIFITDVEGQLDFTKVLDFGLAKLRTEGDESGTITQHGAVFGTPKYMSPEQSRSQELDPRSDIYSLGIIMYECLTGRVPFVSDNPLAILIMHAQDMVPAISVTCPNLVVPFEVEEFIHRMLAKDPNGRPSTAKEVIAGCEHLLNMVPNEFERSLTFEAAQEAGMPIDRSQAYTIPEALFSGQPVDPQMAQHTIAGELVSPLPMPGWKKKILVLGLILLVVAVAGTWFGSHLETLPEKSTQLIPKQLSEGDIPAMKSTLVAISLSANVGDVTVKDADSGQLLGQIEAAQKPLVLTFMKEAKRSVTVSLKRAGAKPVERTFTLNKDQTLPIAEFPTTVIQDRVALSVTLDVGRAKVRIESTGQIFETPKKKGEAFTIALTQGDEQVAVSFEKAGYKSQTLQLRPSEDLTLNVKLERLKKSVGKPRPKAGIKLDPIKKIAPKKQNGPSKLNQIKGF